MKHDLAKLNQVKDSLDSLKYAHRRFLEHIYTNNKPTGIDTLLHTSTNSQDVSIKIWGHEAKALPRTVLNGDKFFIEYVFFVTIGDDRFETSRFYISSEGNLYDSLGDKGKTICDYQAQDVATQICTRVLSAILDSKIFAPTAIEN